MPHLEVRKDTYYRLVKDDDTLFWLLQSVGWAVIGGHPKARYNIGVNEERKGRSERAAKHWITAAKQGHDDALEQVKKYFASGLVSKEDFEAALRGRQAAVDATKSEQREEAYEYYNK